MELQRTTEWYEARRGKVTASCFKEVMADWSWPSIKQAVAAGEGIEVACERAYREGVLARRLNDLTLDRLRSVCEMFFGDYDPKSAKKTLVDFFVGQWRGTLEHATKKIDITPSYDDLSRGAQSYLATLVDEAIEHRVETVNADALDWGVENEPAARQLFIDRNPEYECQQVGSVDHPHESRISCSSDLIVVVDGKPRGTVEFKCPKSRRVHMQALITKRLPAEHKAQIQGNMWVNGTKWGVFASYHPEFSRQYQMVEVRVPRDDDYIGRLSWKVTLFRDLLVKTVARVASEAGMPF